MPQLSRKAKPLLQRVNNVEAECTGGWRKKLPDLDADASPISLSDASSDEDDPAAAALDGPPRKRTKLSSPIAKDAGSPAHEDSARSSGSRRRSNTALNGKKSSKRRGKSDKLQASSSDAQKPVPTSNSQNNDDEDDDDLVMFDQMHSSNSAVRKFGKQYRSRSTIQTSNVHAKAKKSDRKSKHVSASAEEPERAVFHFPTDIPASEPTNGASKAFTAPPTKDGQKKLSKKTQFLKPDDSLPSQPSSAPASSHALSSKGSTSSGPSTPPRQLFDVDDGQFSLLESPDHSPVPPRMGSEVAVCPMCKVEVDRDFLDSFSGGKKLRLKAAMDFCIAHKQQNAQISWTDSKYPTVNWTKFSKRLKKHNSRLRAVLEQRQPSYFRNELSAKVVSGKNRNALRDPEAEGERSLRAVTGYYGTKGARKMMEHITNKFAKKIRKLATEDQLFTEVGVAGFIQAVLVPELAVSLVMEDYSGCDEEEAREILAESAEMGDLVHAEEEETVERKGEETLALPMPDEEPKIRTSPRTKKKKRV